jgi:hypothetical protein
MIFTRCIEVIAPLADARDMRRLSRSTQPIAGVPPYPGRHATAHLSDSAHYLDLALSSMPLSQAMNQSDRLY